MAEQYGFSKPPKQYTGILIQQIPGSSYSILQYTANPVSNHRPMPGGTIQYSYLLVCLSAASKDPRYKVPVPGNRCSPGTSPGSMYHSSPV